MNRYYHGLCCHNCGASRAHLHAYQHVLLDGTTMQEVRCMLCGWNRQRVVIGNAMSRDVPDKSPDREAQERGRAASRASQASKERKRPVYRKAPCTMDGCENMRRVHSRSGLCTRCSQILGHWKQRGCKTPCPIIRRPDGTWTRNEDYTPWGRGRSNALPVDFAR